MRFNLDTSGYGYREEKDKNRLEKLGFKFEKEEKPVLSWYKRGNQVLHIDINSLEELLRFIEEHGSIVIQPPEVTDEWYIEIYDDYRE
jgi:hypothetical protein